jgi:hypothetical protein
MNAAINPYATIIKILGLAGFEAFLNPLYGDLFGFIRLVWLGITFLLFIINMKIFALLLAFLFFYKYYFISAYLLHFPLNYICSMMRILLIVLAIYTTALSCIPCKDSVQTRERGTVVNVIKADQAHQKTADIDLCTPFCTCTCCASVSMQQQITTLPAKAAFSVFEDINFAYLSRTHSGDLTSIWQPPRV